MRYTLRQLEVFLAIAKFENVSRAAEQLSLSQSAASGALRDLEMQFDVQLFDRKGKHLQLNSLGKTLRGRAEKLLEEAEDLQQLLIGKKTAGNLKIGATLTIGNYLAVGLITRYVQCLPDSSVALDVANLSTIVKEIINFDIDLGLIEGELNHPELDIFPWRDDELVCFCAPDHPLAKLSSLSDDDLLSYPWILREPGSGTRQTFDRAMHDLLPELKIAFELQHTEAIKRATEAGLGIACLSKIALNEAFKRGSLVPLPVSNRDFSRKFYLALHKQKYQSASIIQWLKICGLEDVQ